MIKEKFSFKIDDLGLELISFKTDSNNFTYDLGPNLIWNILRISFFIFQFVVDLNPWILAGI